MLLSSKTFEMTGWMKTMTNEELPSETPDTRLAEDDLRDVKDMSKDDLIALVELQHHALMKMQEAQHNATGPMDAKTLNYVKIRMNNIEFELQSPDCKQEDMMANAVAFCEQIKPQGQLPPIPGGGAYI